MDQTQKNDNEMRTLEEELTRMEAELQIKYSSMGKGILEIADKEQKEVDDLVDNIIKKKKQLSEYKNEIPCPDCNTINSNDSVYCKYCGTRLTNGE